MPSLLSAISSSNQQARADTGAMFPIAMVNVGSSGSTYLTFTSIPQTYKHLQLRMITSSANGDTEGYVEYNADYTQSNYYYHRLFGNGSVAGAGGGTGAYIFNGWQTGLSGSFVTSIIDIHDYTNTSKLKTTKCLTAFDTNGGSNSSWIAHNSTLWNNTAAINQIRVRMNSNSFNQYTQATLYGIKG